MFNKEVYNEMFDAVHVSDETRNKIMDIPSERKTKNVKKRVLLIAAVVCAIIACGTAAYATDFFSVRTTIIPESVEMEIRSPENPSKTIVANYHKISAAGTEGSPEYEAFREWDAWSTNYREENSDIIPYVWIPVPHIRMPVSERYIGTVEFYAAENQEMLNKLIEISKKYDLKLHTSYCLFKGENESFFRSGFETVVEMPSDVSIDGYMYEDGSFSLDIIDNEIMNDENEEWYSAVITIYRSIAGTLPPNAAGKFDIDGYEEWTYTTEEGCTVYFLRHTAGGGTMAMYSINDTYLLVGMNAESREEAEEKLETVDLSGICSIYRDEDMTRREPCLPHLDQ